MSARRITQTRLKGLKRRLRELAGKVDCYEELKLTLVLEGWNLDDEAVKGAVKKWLLEFYRFSTYYTRKCYLEEILGLEVGVRDGEELVARCNVLKGMWEDVVGVEDKQAAVLGALLVMNAMTSTGGWNAASVNVDDEEDRGLEAVGGLAAWLGTIAWGKDNGC